MCVCVCDWVCLSESGCLYWCVLFYKQRYASSHSDRDSVSFHICVGGRVRLRMCFTYVCVFHSLSDRISVFGFAF